MTSVPASTLIRRTGKAASRTGQLTRPAAAPADRATTGHAAPDQTARLRPIRVLCVDDHAVLVEGLKAQFAIDGAFEVVGGLLSADKLVAEARRLKPDVVILDIEMPGPSAFEEADRLRRACPNVRIMILSAHVRDGFITAAHAAGVNAYFTKSDNVEVIVAGLLEMVSGDRKNFIMGARVRERCSAASLAGRSGSRRVSPPRGEASAEAGSPSTLLASLTNREAEILRLIGRGMPRTQIAALLCRSVKTIDGHQDRMMRKLAIKSRADLMRFAIREGLAQA